MSTVSSKLHWARGPSLTHLSPPSLTHSSLPPSHPYIHTHLSRMSTVSSKLHWARGPLPFLLMPCRVIAMRWPREVITSTRMAMCLLGGGRRRVMGVSEEMGEKRRGRGKGGNVRMREREEACRPLLFLSTPYIPPYTHIHTHSLSLTHTHTHTHIHTPVVDVRAVELNHVPHLLQQRHSHRLDAQHLYRLNEVVADGAGVVHAGEGKHLKRERERVCECERERVCVCVSERESVCV
jgi:hypothetical protein